MFQGKFKLKNFDKYMGDHHDVCYRSSWEFALLTWLDDNPSVKKWSSETTIIKYLCPTDGKFHRYFVDFTIVFNNGETFLIEVKPRKQTLEPQKRKNSKTYLREVATYIKNQAKWEAARNYADANGWKFLVWTEDTLHKMGLKVLK